MRKKRAADGSIEFVSASSEKRFMREGESCLIWNKLARDAVGDVFIQQEELEDDVVKDVVRRGEGVRHPGGLMGERVC